MPTTDYAVGGRDGESQPFVHKLAAKVVHLSTLLSIIFSASRFVARPLSSARASSARLTSGLRSIKIRCGLFFSLIDLYAVYRALLKKIRGYSFCGIPRRARKKFWRSELRPPPEFSHRALRFSLRRVWLLVEVWRTPYNFSFVLPFSFGCTDLCRLEDYFVTK